MNCENFNDLLHEYLDETLDADVQAAAREHLEHCRDCRRALMREETFAISVRHALDRATADLSVRPETRRNVLKALEWNATRSHGWLHAWRSIISIRPARAGVAIVCVLLLFLGIPLSRRSSKDSVAQTIPRAGHDSCVIDVPV